MKLKFAILVIYFSIIHTPGLCQSNLPDKDRYLKVGDKIPENLWLHMINYPQKTARLADFKDKPMLLDFWSIGCASCILSWPHLMDLQKQFKGKINILLANPWQDETAVKKIIDKRKQAAGVQLTLPSICGDSILLDYFEISGVPVEYWIDKNGVIQSITGISSANVKNITSFLSTGRIAAPKLIQNDEFIDRNVWKPLFINGNGGTPLNIYWQSTFAKADRRLFMGFGIGCDTSGNCYAIAISSIKEMYQLAYGNPKTYAGIKPLPRNKVVLEVADTSKYVSNVDGEYYYDNNYTYQLLGVHTDVASIRKAMQEDLQRYIGLQVSWEKRIKKCLVVTAFDTTKCIYKGGRRKQNVIYNLIDINQVSLPLLVSKLEEMIYAQSPYPLLLESNYKGLLGQIFIETDVTNPLMLDKALHKYGLSIELKDREIEVLVLSEPKNDDYPFSSYLKKK